MTAFVLPLALDNVSFEIGGIRLIKAISCTFDAGPRTAIIGPNGAGKTTFFRCLTHQYKPTSGHVVYRGDDITGSHTHQIARRGIGIKTQVPSVFDGLDVRENIWLSARRYPTNRESNRVFDEILERIGLTGVANRLVGQLAHGERQGVELAIVLTGDPELILLDEPTAGMTHEEVQITDVICLIRF